MSDSTADKKRRVGRSPAYPFIPVAKAIDQARALYEQEGDYPTPLSSAFSAWGYGPKSSGARQTLATLKYYRLIDVQGDGDARKVKVSELARRVILDQREDDTEKRRLIREIALMPSAHRALYKAYPSGLPSDSNVTHHLIFDLQYNKEAARDLLAEYKETASYARIYEPLMGVDNLPDSDDTLEDDTIATETHMLEAQSLSTKPPQVGAPQLRAPPIQPEMSTPAIPGETEWMRNPLGKSTAIRILASGDMGSREISRLIKLLEAQKAVMDDDEEDADA